MIRALHTASTGMRCQQLKIDLIAHNLANVNTVGFKRSRGDFQELLYQTMRGPGLSSGTGTRVPTGVQVGLGSRIVATQKIFSEGALQQTDNPLDLAIGGRGFFQVMKPDGNLVYTRAGSFKTDDQGNLVTSDGYLVQPRITIPPDALVVEIARDGTVSVTQPGQTEPKELGRIELAIFNNPAGLKAEGGNFFSPTASSGEPLVGIPGEEQYGRLIQGMLESSNVQVVEEMVEMISGQRAYEMNSKVIQTADQMLRTASQLR